MNYNIIEIIQALENYDIEKLEAISNTIYIDFSEPNIAEDIFSYLIYNYDTLIEDSEYDKSRNDIRIRLTIKQSN